MFGLIYKITNTLNGKLYIGQTTMALADRWSAHVKASRLQRRRGHLHSAIAKYGLEHFVIEPIDAADDQFELDLKERDWIYRLRTRDNLVGYNIALGGGSPPAKLPEVAAKISATALSQNRKFTGDRLAKCGKHNIGTHHSEETKSKMSETQKGKPKSEEHKAKLRKDFCKRGHGRTPENVCSKTRNCKVCKVQLISNKRRAHQLITGGLKGEA